MGVQIYPPKIFTTTAFLDLLTAWSDKQQPSSLLSYIVTTIQFKILCAEAGLRTHAYKASQGIRNVSLGHSFLPGKGMVFFSFRMPWLDHLCF